jgi:hypothetical protein
VLVCPFCGAAESERFVMEGTRVVVFPCQFTAELDRSLGDEELAGALRAKYAGAGESYFRGMCDRLHLYVAKGEGARLLGAGPTGHDAV